MSKIYITLLSVAVIVLLFVVLFRPAPRTETVESHRVDTVRMRDTVRDTVFVPSERYVVRHDTVWLHGERDTMLREVSVPIERQMYRTDDYSAVVEGYRARLVELELYRNTVYVTRDRFITTDRGRRWGVGVQVGYGYINGRPAPYIGLGVQYNIVSW